jgi:hypothetical protein
MMHTYQANLEMEKVSPITTVKDCFSKNTFNTHIITVSVHFRSINQMLNYEARITSLHRKTLFKALETCVYSDSTCHKDISSNNNYCVSVICLLNSCDSTLVKTQYFISLSNKERHHTDRSESMYQYGKLYSATML